MRAWRRGDGDGDGRLIELDAPAGSFWLIDGGGRVTARYGGSEWTLEEESGRDLYAVEGGALVVHRTRTWRGQSAVERRVILEGLVVDEPAAARAAAGQARLAAIAGAGDALELGGDVLRVDAARARLRERILVTDDAAAADTLRRLVALADVVADEPAFGRMGGPTDRDRAEAAAQLQALVDDVLASA